MWISHQLKTEGNATSSKYVGCGCKFATIVFAKVNLAARNDMSASRSRKTLNRRVVSCFHSHTAQSEKREELANPPTSGTLMWWECGVW